MTHDIRIEYLPERRVAVVAHHGPLETVDDTRRPLYQHLILQELIGGPSAIRFPHGPHVEEGHRIDLLVGTPRHFEGDDVATVDVLDEGPYAVLDYEGPVGGLAAARQALLDWIKREGHQPRGPLLQVHLMDEIEGETEQQIQVPLRPADG